MTKKSIKQTFVVIGVLAVLLLGAFAPVLSQSANAIICRFESTACVTSWNGADILVYSDSGSTTKFSVDGATGNTFTAGTLEVDGTANFDGTADFDSTVDLSGATVTYPSSSSLTTLTVSGASALNGGITADTTAFSVADTSGNTAIGGTLAVTGATALNGGITADTTAFSVADTSGNTQIGGTLGVTGATTLTGNTDVAGTLQYGANDLYPLGYATVNQEIVCGTTATFTETVEVTPTGLTTATYVIASQITTPAAGAVFLTVSDPTTSTFVLSSWESDYTAGTTGITAHWCAVGDQ